MVQGNDAIAIIIVLLVAVVVIAGIFIARITGNVRTRDGPSTDGGSGSEPGQQAPSGIFLQDRR